MEKYILKKYKCPKSNREITNKAIKTRTGHLVIDYGESCIEWVCRLISKNNKLE